MRTTPDKSRWNQTRWLAYLDGWHAGVDPTFKPSRSYAGDDARSYNVGAIEGKANLILFKERRVRTN